MADLIRDITHVPLVEPLGEPAGGNQESLDIVDFGNFVIEKGRHYMLRVSLPSDRGTKRSEAHPIILRHLRAN